MSRIEALLAKLCPDGVEFRAIGDFGELVRGNGMPKSDFADTGVGCIHYGQIYTYYGVWTTETKSFVPPEKAARLAKVDPGDLIITNTSENIDDVCKAVAWLGDTQIVTGGHATVLKHDQDSKYISYYLQTPSFFAEKKRHATGTKVIDVSAKSLAKIKIPIPPLEIQREIVAILDGFTKLEAELELEFGAESPAAVELGLRYVELVAQERQMKERESEVERALAGILTAEQKRRLGEWAPILQSGQVVYAARGLNLLPAVGPKTPASEGLGGLPFYLPTAFLPGAGAFLPEVMRYCKAGLAITPE